MEVPSTSWRATPWSPAEARAEAPLAARWRARPGLVRHGFTHFELELTVFTATVAGEGPSDGLWWPIERLGEQALPTVMKKLVEHALKPG